MHVITPRAADKLRYNWPVDASEGRPNPAYISAGRGQLVNTPIYPRYGSQRDNSKRRVATPLIAHETSYLVVKNEVPRYLAHERIYGGGAPYSQMGKQQRKNSYCKSQ